MATASSTARAPTTVAPIRLAATVVKGFGRGSKELGIPTANLAADEVRAALARVEAGIYYGWALLRGRPYKACVSVGWNPTFDDVKEKTVEPHLLHDFGGDDFYGEVGARCARRSSDGASRIGVSSHGSNVTATCGTPSLDAARPFRKMACL